ncbi:hypothetical protein ACFLXQ_02275 [Chloroflexota bacterium]
MPKFAVYYIPEADSKFYQLGSSILGYDVRAGKPVTMPSELQLELGKFDLAWRTAAQFYGFHLTIGDAIDFDLNNLPQIETESLAILDCFASPEKFTLYKSQEFIPDWGLPIVLCYDPNEYLRTFHALVVACINPLGTGSGYLERYLENPDQYDDELYKASRIRKFYSPFILGDFAPHFTLLNSYEGANRTKLVQKFERIFSEFTEFTVNSICLLVQYRAEENWVIYREFEC